MKINNNFNQIRKWFATIVIGLIIVFVGWLAHGVNQMETSINRANQLEARVVKLESWIDDWLYVLRVPERDQAQDSKLSELERRIKRLEAWRDSVQNP